MGLSRQEYWSGLPFPSLGDLPDPGIEPGSPALQEDSLSVELQGKIYMCVCVYVCMYIHVYMFFLSRLSSLCSGSVNGLLCYLLKCFKLVNGLFLFCWVFVAMHRLSLVAAGGGSSLLWCPGFSLWGLLLLGEHRLYSVGSHRCSSQAVEQGSVVVTHRLNCSVARGIFWDQRSHLCPLHWQESS